jgi:hypothetical protein
MALAQRWEIVLAWILRGAIVMTAAIHAIRGDVIYGVFCLAAVAIAIVPGALARNARAVWPVEIELLYLWFLISDMLLGNLAGMYIYLPWYDKALHLSSAVLIGLVAFFVVYLAHFLGRIQRHPWIDGVAILLITLGLGALWEIGEYAVDHLLHRATQSSPLLGPLDDTMWDLILDGLGGTLGAILGPIYMHRSARSRTRLAAVAAVLDRREADRARAAGNRQLASRSRRSCAPTDATAERGAAL